MFGGYAPLGWSVQTARSDNGPSQKGSVLAPNQAGLLYQRDPTPCKFRPYENNEVYFHFAHNFCGACGAMRWLKATLWQYLTDLGYNVDKTGIMTVDTPMTLEEVAEPDVPSLPHGEAFGNLVPPMDSYIPMAEYIERMKDPNRVDGYFPIRIPKREFMKYVRDNDGSPNSVIASMLFKMYTKALPEEKKFTAGIAYNYRADVGCPQTYRDILRQCMFHMTSR